MTLSYRQLSFFRPALLLVVCALVGVTTLWWPRPGFAQRDTGIMVVHATDPDGAPLPGAMVVARGPVGTQTQYTGVDGSARFPGLYPGQGYTATFTLDGFTTVERHGLEISAQRTTEFTVTMRLSSIEETVLVIGASPLVDLRGTNVGAAYTDDLIDMTPTASGLWAGVLDHVPGVMNSLDVGGGESGQQSAPRAWGSQGVNNQYNVNGADTSDPAAIGGAGAYYAVGAFEEVSVSVASQDIETKTAGVVIDMVLKSGSNDWHAGVKYFYESAGLVSNNVDADLEAQGITEGTPNELLSDLDIQAGGPIVRDRAWFFVDYWNFELHKVILGLEERDRTTLQDWTINLNGQISDNNKVSGRYIRSVKYRNNRGASRTRPYLGIVQDSNSHIPQLQWQSVLNQNMFLDVRYSVLRGNVAILRRWSPGGDEPAAVPSDRSATYDFGIGNYVMRPSLPRGEFFDERDNNNLAATMSWYKTGESTSHDVKFGSSYQLIDYFAPAVQPNGYRPYVDSRRDAGGNPNWEDGVPREVRLYNNSTCFVLDSDCWKPDNAYTASGKAASLFVQDTMTINNKLTVVGGLRWDFATNWNPEQNRLDSRWCGMEPLANPEMFCGGSFPRQPNSVTWKDLVPRVGVIYDPLGDGRWALKFNYSRYAEALGIRFSSATNINDIGREDWNWTDANGDGEFQFGEHTTFRDARFPGLGTTIDPDLVSPFVNEYTFGVEHEIADNMLIAVTGIFRGMNNDTGTVDIGRPFGPMLDSARCLAECDLSYGGDPYYPVQSVDPGNDGIIGTADDGLPVTLWARDPAVANKGNRLGTNTPQWGFEDYTDYQGVNFTFRKRWAGNWQMLASYDYGRGYSSSAGTTPSGYDNNRRQELFGSRPHMFKVTANYLFAEPVGVNLGIFVRANSGEPVRADYNYDDALIEPPNSPYCCQGNQVRTVDARGEGNVVGSERPQREAFVTIIDVRAEKQVTIGRYGVLHFYVDVFNLFNSNVVTEFEWTLGRRYGEITDILPPRVIRIGGAWDF